MQDDILKGFSTLLDPTISETAPSKAVVVREKKTWFESLQEQLALQDNFQSQFEKIYTIPDLHARCLCYIGLLNKFVTNPTVSLAQLNKIFENLVCCFNNGSVVVLEAKSFDGISCFVERFLHRCEVSKRSDDLLILYGHLMSFLAHLRKDLIRFADNLPLKTVFLRSAHMLDLNQLFQRQCKYNSFEPMVPPYIWKIVSQLEQFNLEGFYLGKSYRRTLESLFIDEDYYAHNSIPDLPLKSVFTDNPFYTRMRQLLSSNKCAFSENISTSSKYYFVVATLVPVYNFRKSHASSKHSLYSHLELAEDNMLRGMYLMAFSLYSSSSYQNNYETDDILEKAVCHAQVVHISHTDRAMKQDMESDFVHSLFSFIVHKLGDTASGKVLDIFLDGCPNISSYLKPAPEVSDDLDYLYGRNDYCIYNIQQLLKKLKGPKTMNCHPLECHINEIRPHPYFVDTLAAAFRVLLYELIVLGDLFSGPAVSL